MSLFRSGLPRYTPALSPRGDRFFGSPRELVRSLLRRPWGRTRDCGSLRAKHVHNLPPGTVTGELNRFYHVEANLPEGMQGSDIAFLRIGNDCADAGVRKDELVEELPNYNRTQAQTCHAKLPYGEVDAS